MNMDYRLQSPYCSGYKTPIQQKGLIMQHLIVRKLTRRELEDKYLRLIDENYDLKRENNVQKEKIKVLTTKLLRMTKENSRYKSREFLFMNDNNEIQEAEEFFHSRRPMSAAISRRTTDDLRNSTPNLASKFKSDFSMQENLSSGNGGNNNNKLMENSGNIKNVDRMKEMQEEIEKLSDELKKLHEIGDLEKRMNAQLEIQVAELKEKLSCKKYEMELQANVEVAELNKKIKELEAKISAMESDYDKKLEESKSSHEKLNQTLEKERNKAKRLEAEAHDYEASRKMIEELMSQISSLEHEKAEILNQYEKYATMAEEVMNYKQLMSELSLTLEEKEKELEQERADRASIEHSQEDLLRKMKELQKENDELVVKLEGLKSENESLLTKNKNLEDRMKTLEDQNKQQLHQVNQTLKNPTPIVRDEETKLASSARDIQQLHEMQEQYMRQKSLEATSPEKSISSQKSSTQSMRLSSLPPNLTVPSVKHVDEKRPASSGKELKIVPTIIEPSNSNASEILKDQPESPMNSQDPPAIPSTSKVFAEMFSQSVSKDDEFDTRTFSIDQVSDADGVSELIEDDDEDYEYLFQADNFN